MRSFRRPGRLTALCAAAALVALPAGVASATPLAASGSGLATATSPPVTKLPVPSWAIPGNLIGPARPGARIELRLWMAWQGGSDAAALGQAVSSPASPLYRHYLTNTAFLREFAPSPSEVQAVQSWARSAGLSPAEVPTSRLYVGVTGTVLQTERAFHTGLGLYRYQGLTLFAPTTAPVMPSQLGHLVVAVTGLDDSENLVRTDHIGPNDSTGPQASPVAAFVNAPPCSEYYGQQTDTSLPQVNGAAPSDVICGNTPDTLRQAYGVKDAIAGGLTGKGQTVVVIDAWSSPTIQTDVATWSTNHDGSAPLSYTDASPPGLSNAPEGPSSPLDAVTGLPLSALVDPAGWSVEETLDVEAIHGMAPGAAVTYVGGVTPEGPALEVALLYAVENGLGNEISNSYGFAGEGAAGEYGPIYDQIFTMAETTGIGVYFSSGDSGDELAATGTAQPDYPASDPLVTAVGGTSVELDNAGQVAFETGWGTGKSLLSADRRSWSPAPPGNYVYGGGGGVSTNFAQPSYQAGVVPASLSQLAGGPPMRVEPDVSADGDPNTGYIIGLDETFPDGSTKYGEFREGGTSLACPLTAGLMALVSQQLGAEVGFANPTLYTLARAHVPFVRDVLAPASLHSEVRTDFKNGVDATGGTTTSLRSFAQVGTLQLLPGYDDVTGIGTPNGQSFVTLGNVVPPSVPESPVPVLLGVAGLAVAGGLILLRRRRPSTA